MYIMLKYTYIYKKLGTFDQLIKYTGMAMIITYTKKKMKYFMMTTMNYPV